MKIALLAGVLSAFAPSRRIALTVSGSAAHTLRRDQEKDLVVKHLRKEVGALAVVWHSAACGREGRTVWRDGQWEQGVLLRLHLSRSGCGRAPGLPCW